MTSSERAAQAVAKLIELHGGHDAFFRALDESHRQFEEAWNQDALAIGRILRAHLVIEHFLTKFIESKNPALGPVADARLTFAQKVELLSAKDPLTVELKGGLKRVNKIRNSLAHTLRIAVTAEDVAAIQAVPLFRAATLEKAKRDGVAHREPIAVLEDFAKFAAALLQAGSEPNAGLMVKALQSTRGR
jgi:hypothetical protein